MSAKEIKFPENDYLFPSVAESSRLLVGCRRQDYSASRIARAVEDCNAHILNLNVTSFGEKGDYSDIDIDERSDAKFPVIFDIRVNHRSASSISRSLERYGYTVLGTSSSSDPDDTTARRIQDLFHYLDI